MQLFGSFKMRNYSNIFLAASLLAGSLAAQDGQTVTFRIRSNAVVVDLIATDGKGNFVSDLKVEEVEVKEDGKKQQLLHFELVDNVPPAEPGTPALGVNFPRTRLGMIYLPLDYDGAQVIEDVSPRDLSAEILKRFGVAMSEPMLC